MSQSMRKSFVKKIQIQNYKSIGRCNVDLQPFTLLVGLNGTGKSNFLDALRFIADSLRSTLEHALRDRGGIKEVRRRSGGHPTHFGIALELNLPDGGSAYYAFRIGALPNGDFITQKEICRIMLPRFESNKLGSNEHFYIVEAGKLKDSSSPALPKKIEVDRLYLVLASALPEFRILYDSLSHMGFYNLNPECIRNLQDTDPGDLLLRDGRNIATVIRRLKGQRPEYLDRIIEYLRSVVPGIMGVDPRSLGPKETLEFKQNMAGAESPWRFFASNMSDGTLRALGVLVAVFQSRGNGRPRIPFIGIEEPEVAIHPGAAIKLMDALLEGQKNVQLVITTHSPDLLNHKDISPESILAVTNEGGETVIAPVDEASVKAIRDNLYTVGELLRLGQIEPSKEIYKESVKQMELFQS